MLSFDDCKALLTLNRLQIGGGRHVRSLLDDGISPSEILRRIEGENFAGKAEALGKVMSTFDPERELQTAERLGIRFLFLGDEIYPDILKNIADPPLVLYMRGTLLPEDEAAMAVVGSRHPSFYGITQARRFAKELAEAGLTIVSGLAAGIDQAAHEAALSIRHGRTLAVLGCGVDQCYPKDNKKLFDRIADQGAVLSEFPIGTPPFAENFPRRNRIISGLALGTLVVEAHERSGTLITAHQALEQGREVFAIPGPVDQLTSRGTHRLIREGAFLTEDPQQILEAIAPWLRKFAFSLKLEKTPDIPVEKREEEALFSESGEEKNLLDMLRLEGPSDPDALAARGLFKPSRIAVLLMHLELSGKVRKSADGTYSAAGKN